MQVKAKHLQKFPKTESNLQKVKINSEMGI